MFDFVCLYIVFILIFKQRKEIKWLTEFKADSQFYFLSHQPLSQLKLNRNTCLDSNATLSLMRTMSEKDLIGYSGDFETPKVNFIRAQIVCE